MKVLLLVFSLPFFYLARFCEIFGLWGLNDDVKRCLKVIDCTDDKIPDKAVFFLMVAEDHRNFLHIGIDPFAILRAMTLRLVRGEQQGASTIEQQFVRVVTGKYNRSVSRKVREQLLAILVSKKSTKEKVSKAYLNVAYFGTGIDGIHAMIDKLGVSLSKVSDEELMGILARLKYPQPKISTVNWQKRISQRQKYLLARKLKALDF